MAELGGIDILVNNAAHQASFKSIEDISDEEWELTFKVNIHAMFYLTKAAVPHMRPGSAIINTASINSDAPKSDVAGLCDDQGCNSKFYSRIGAVARGKGNSRKRRSSRTDLDSAHTFYHAAGCGCELRQTSADETAGPASRACDDIRHAGRSAFELRIGCDHRGDRRKTDSLKVASPPNSFEAMPPLSGLSSAMSTCVILPLVK
jgi:hypothetical protein